MTKILTHQCVPIYWELTKKVDFLIISQLFIPFWLVKIFTKVLANWNFSKSKFRLFKISANQNFGKIIDKRFFVETKENEVVEIFFSQKILTVNKFQMLKYPTLRPDWQETYFSSVLVLRTFLRHRKEFFSRNLFFRRVTF